MAKRFVLICGIPRSMSDLLLDILAQRKDSVVVSCVTPMDDSYGALRASWIRSRAVKTLAHQDAAAFHGTMERMLHSLTDTFFRSFDGYADAQFVFDKGRNWIDHADALMASHPGAKIVFTIRHPLDAFASMYNLHKRYPILDDSIPGETLVSKIGRHFDPRAGRMPDDPRPQENLGGYLARVESILQAERTAPNVVFLKAEDLVSDPEATMNQLYQDLEIEPAKHDFDRVEARTIELDCLNNFQIVHRRESGPVKKSDTKWQDVVPIRAARHLASQFPHVFEKWGYLPEPGGRAIVAQGPSRGIPRPPRNQNGS